MMQEDLIDFPVADSYLCHYFHQGMTPRHPPTCYRETPRTPDPDRVHDLEEEISRMKVRIEKLADIRTYSAAREANPPAKRRSLREGIPE